MKKINEKLHSIHLPYYLSLAGCFQVLIAFLINRILLYLEDDSNDDYSKDDYSNDDYYNLVMAAIGAMYAQITISIAYKYAEVSTLFPLMYFNIAIFFIIDSL